MLVWTNTVAQKKRIYWTQTLQTSCEIQTLRSQLGVGVTSACVCVERVRQMNEGNEIVGGKCNFPKSYLLNTP